MSLEPTTDRRPPPTPTTPPIARHADSSPTSCPEPFGRARASGATASLERAWAIVRHDRDLIEQVDMPQRMTALCKALGGHLGCASPHCAELCSADEVCRAISEIETLAIGAWLVPDLQGARATALASLRCRESVRSRSRSRDVAGDEMSATAAMTHSTYAALRPYADVIHDLHGRLWAVYGPFWALVARRPRALAEYRAITPTPRDVDIYLASLDSPLAQDRVSRLMEVDEGRCAKAVARMRAVAVARCIARDVAYPRPSDTQWASARRTLASTLGANPDSSLLLVAKKYVRSSPNQGAVVVRRVATLYAARRACPLAEESRSKTIIGRATAISAGAGRETIQDDVVPAVARLQSLGTGKYALGAWMRAIVLGKPIAIYTRLLLASGHQSTTTLSLPASPMGAGPMSAHTARLGQQSLTVKRRAVSMDGCLVAALVRDAYVVQPIVDRATWRLFRSLAVTPVNAQAATDAQIILAGGNVPAARERAAVAYAAWFVCRGGRVDGYDYVLLGSLLERAGLTAPHNIVDRLVALWN